MVEKLTPEISDFSSDAKDRHKQSNFEYLYEQAKKTGDERMEVLAYMEAAKERLYRYFDITDLSTIEAVRLRIIVEESLTKEKRDLKAAKNQEIDISSVIDTEVEAAARWLAELYGILPQDVPYVYILTDHTDGNNEYKFEIAHHQAAEKKKKELEKIGHHVFLGSEIPKDFKEYLRRIREQSHKP
ncbi:MAG: hypothetical protein UX68_C0002G0001 [Parcubacteria group bacterium GW2011_GWA2_46_9]|nr:MAG: hypothetical protein UX68_C0002G0001 [Parcubacteria group bacterium GW2011_GWA2_46_9]